MIKNIIKMLQADTFYLGDHDIDFAKGKFEQPMNIEENKKHIMRNNYGK
tara:strand:+ start:6592 stop:6738 length:147 start_codon:yes stop_codon:yes gene_type:complete